MKSILNPYPHLCPSAFPTEDATHLSAGSTLVAPLAPPRHKAFPPVPGKSLPFFNGNSMEMWWDFHGILRGCLRGFLGDVWGFSWDFNRISMGFNRNSRVVLVGFHGDISALWQWVMEDMEGRLAWCISWVVEVGTWCWDDDCGASAEKRWREGTVYAIIFAQTLMKLAMNWKYKPVNTKCSDTPNVQFLLICIQLHPIIPSHSRNPNPI